MWKLTFCPHFRICSFTFLLIIVEIIVFVAEAIHSGVANKKLNKYFFLGSELQTQQVFGMRIPYAIRYYGHIHRLVLPFFLHYSFNHLFISILIQMLIGFNLEKIIGTFKMALFWILTVFGGNIFGALTTSKYSVGSDCYVFALFGGMIGITLTIMCRPNPVPQASEA